MAQLPADRTKLALAQSNQVPSAVASSQRNKDAITEVYDTVDKLFEFTQGLISAGTLSRLGIINVKDYGAKGDGVTDDTNGFIASCNAAVAAGVPMYVPPGTYLTNKTNHLNVPSIIGQNATIVVNDAYSFKFGNDFVLSGVKVLTNNYALLASVSLVPVFTHRATGQKNIMLDNVEFTANLPVLDGTMRAAYALSASAVEGVKFRNVTAKGFLTAFQVTGASKNIQGSNVIFENTQTGFYMSGSNPESATDMTYIKDVQFNNVTHTNTKTQSLNYTTIQGADTFIMEKCENVTITNLKAENLIERAVYANCVNNLVTTGFNLLNCPGGAVKFAGAHRNDIGLANHAKNAFISNLNLRNIDVEGGMFNLYFAENISITNCNFDGNALGDVFIYIENHIEKLKVKNNIVEGLKRSFFYYWNQGTRTGLGIPTNPEGNFPAYMYDVTIENNYCRNICSVDYSFFRSQDDGTVLTSGYAGTGGNRRFKTLNLIGNKIINSDNLVTGASTSNCKGLIDLKDVEGLKVIDNIIQGWKGKNDSAGNQIAFPVQVGTNCYSVIIRHREVLSSYHILKKFPMGLLNVSSGSQIEFAIYDRLTNLSDHGVILPQVSGTDLETVQDLNTKFTIKGHIEKTQAADDSTYLVGYNVGTFAVPNVVGWVEVNTAAGEWGKFGFTSAGATIKNAGSNAIYDTGGFTASKINVFKNTIDPQYYGVRNKSGVAGRVMIDYNITTV